MPRYGYSSVDPYRLFPRMAGITINFQSSPYNMLVVPAAVYWPATSVICGRVAGFPWPPDCYAGAGTQYALAGLPIRAACC